MTEGICEFESEVEGSGVWPKQVMALSKKTRTRKERISTSKECGETDGRVWWLDVSGAAGKKAFNRRGRKERPLGSQRKGRAGTPIPEESKRKLSCRQGWFQLAGFKSFVAVIDFFPVHYVPPGGEIFGTSVVVFQVVGVLPDIVAENREEALRERIVLVRRRNDLHLTAGLPGKPDPSAAELFCAGFVEFGLEVIEVTEGFCDRVADWAGGIASAFGFHDLPEHGVIHVTAAVVADCATNIFRNRTEIAD